MIQLIIGSNRLLGSCDMFVLDCLMQVDLGSWTKEKRFIQKLAVYRCP